MASSPTKEYSLEAMLVLVCRRPQMFTGSQDFFPASIFIDGYAMGRGGAESEELKSFRDWLATECYQRFKLLRNWGWSYYVAQMFSKDREALQALPNLWLLYKRGATLKNVRKASLLKPVPLPAEFTGEQ